MAHLHWFFGLDAMELGRQRSVRGTFHDAVMCFGVSTFRNVAFGVTSLIVSCIKMEELHKILLLAVQPSFLVMRFHFFFHPYRPLWYFESPRVMYSLGLVS